MRPRRAFRRSFTGDCRPCRPLFSAALPSHPDERREEVVLPGEVPSPLNPPSGCHFHPRCPHAMERCKGEAPALKEIAPGRLSACHLNDG